MIHKIDVLIRADELSSPSTKEKLARIDIGKHGVLEKRIGAVGGIESRHGVVAAARHARMVTARPASAGRAASGASVGTSWLPGQDSNLRPSG